MGRKQYTSADDIFVDVKAFGYYQWFLCFLYAYHFTIVAINNGFMAFGGVPPQFVCNDGINNYSGIPVDATHCDDVYYNCTKGNLTYQYNFYSIVVQYDLVCDNAYYVDLITSLQMAGIMVGALTSGPVVDYLGRKWTFLATVTVEMTLGSLVTLAPTWQIHAMMRFLIGIFMGADMNTGWVFMGEYTTNKYRFLFRAIANILPNFIFPLIAYVTQNWKSFELVGNLCCLPLVCVLIPFLTFESPRWLIQKGRRKEAVETFKRVARYNGVKDFELCEEDLPAPPPVAEKQYFWKLFGTRQLATFSICAMLTWFVASMINYGMYFDIGNLPFNIYITQILLSIIQTVAEMPIAIADTFQAKMNRRALLIVFLFLSSLANVAMVVLMVTPVRTNANLFWLFSVASVLGQTAIGIVFDTAYVYQIELFPTLLRSTAGALCSASARLGAVVAPQLLFLEKKWEPLPYVCFAAVGFLGVIMDFFLLPNTKDKVLMENITDKLKTFEEEKEEAMDKFPVSTVQQHGYQKPYDGESKELEDIKSSSFEPSSGISHRNREDKF